MSDNYPDDNKSNAEAIRKANEKFTKALQRIDYMSKKNSIWYPMGYAMGAAAARGYAEELRKKSDNDEGK